MSQQRNDVRQLHWTVQTDGQQTLHDPDWTRAQRFLEHGERCEARVTRINRGGVEVQFGRLRGFVPNSHLISVPRGIRGHRRRQAKSELIGQILSLAVIEVERQQRRLVLSERDTDSINRRQLFEQLTPGETRNVYGLASTFYAAGMGFGLGVFDVIDRTRLNTPGRFLFNPDR